MKKTVSFYLVLLFIFSCSKKRIQPPSPLPPVPTKLQIEWHEMELNAFIHFSINTFTNKEWGYGNESPQTFNPEHLEVNQWLKVLKEVGFKGLILTCKHHDGFCLWPSNYTEYDITSSPYKKGRGDIVKEVSEACKSNGLKFGVYLSPWDRNHPMYGEQEYIDYYRNQLKEIFNTYGPIYEMWFDGANGGNGYYGGKNEVREIDRKTYYNWPATIKLIKSIDSTTLFFSDAGPDIRWCGNEQGFAGETNWNLLAPDTLYAGKPGITGLLNTGSITGDKWIPAEVDVSIRPGWFYHNYEDSLVKSPQQLFNIYLQSVGRGSVLLLNIPPGRNGLFHKNDVESLKGFKEILDSTFKNNIASGANIIVSNYRGNDEKFDGYKLTDGNKNTYWATDDLIRSGYADIKFDEPKKVNYIILQEYIQLGQRVKAFQIEAFVNGEWIGISRGTTIGYKRILKINPAETDHIRLIIDDSRASLALSNIEIY